MRKVTASISYSDTHHAGVFDPERVIQCVRSAFPGALTNPVDHSQKEVEDLFRHFGKSEDELNEPVLAVLRQVLRKAIRNGPTFTLTIPFEDGSSVKGQVRRYNITLEADDALSEPNWQRIVDFLRNIELGSFRVQSEGAEVS